MSGSEIKGSPVNALVFGDAGAISETEVVVQFLALLAAGLGTAFALDKWVGHETPTLFYLAVFGSFISYIYSAPPLKLKQSGWAGNYALGSSYISLPWWAGQVNSMCRTSFHILTLPLGTRRSLCIFQGYT